MSNAIVANRYAVALYEIAIEKDALEAVEKELKIIEEILANDEKLYTYMNNPRVTTVNKKNLVTASFEKFSKDVSNTLLFLIDKGRFNILPDMIRSFVEMKNDAMGIAEADVYSVRPLKKKELKQIEEVFAKRLNKKSLLLNNIVDETLIGGIRLQFGNKIYDGTLKTQLKRLEEKLVSKN